MSESWWEYLVRASNNAPNVQIAKAAKVDPGSVSRWKSGKSKPSADNVINFARSYSRNPVEALTAAGYIAADEVHGAIEIQASITELDDRTLTNELLQRLSYFRSVAAAVERLPKTGESNDTDITQQRSRPASTIDSSPGGGAEGSKPPMNAGDKPADQTPGNQGNNVVTPASWGDSSEPPPDINDEGVAADADDE